MSLAEGYRAHLSNPYARQFLDFIGKAEGADYDTAFGGGKLASLGDHPRQLHDFKQTDGKWNKTSAAGKYQFLAPTWDGVRNELGLSDFSPESQDLGALHLIAQSGALDDVLNGNFDSAIDKTKGVWASFPNAPYPQPTRDQAFVDAHFNVPVPSAEGVTSTTPTPPTKKALPMATSIPDTNPTAGLGEIQDSLKRFIPNITVDPGLVQAVANTRKPNINALPLAMAAMLSGDKGIQQLGAQLYAAGQDARNLQQLGDAGYVDPSSGQFFENPTKRANMEMALLPQAIELQKNIENNITQRGANDARIMQLQQQFNYQNQTVGLRADANRVAQMRLFNDPYYQYNARKMGIDPANLSGGFGGTMPGLGGNAPMMTGGGAPAQPSALPQATGQMNAPTPSAPAPGQMNAPAPQASTPQSALPQATGQANQSPRRIIDALPPGAQVFAVDATTGDQIMRYGGDFWKALPDGRFEQSIPSTDAAGWVMHEEYQKNVGELQRSLATAKKAQRWTRQISDVPEMFDGVTAGTSWLGSFTDWTSALANRAIESYLSDKGTETTPDPYKTRMNVLENSAEVLHALYGAALTLGEAARARAFNPDHLSDSAQVIAALREAPSFIGDMKAKYGEAAMTAALTRSGLSFRDVVTPKKGESMEGLGNGQ